MIKIVIFRRLISQILVNMIIPVSYVVQKEFESEFDEFKSRICDFLYPKIIEENGLITNRIGIVINSQMENVGRHHLAILRHCPYHIPIHTPDICV